MRLKRNEATAKRGVRTSGDGVLQVPRCESLHEIVIVVVVVGVTVTLESSGI